MRTRHREKALFTAVLMVLMENYKINVRIIIYLNIFRIYKTKKDIGPLNSYIKYDNLSIVLI